MVGYLFLNNILVMIRTKPSEFAQINSTVKHVSPDESYNLLMESKKISYLFYYSF